MQTKYLVPLAIATAGLVAAAIYAVRVSERETAAVYEPAALLPDLAPEVNAVNEIAVKSRDAAFSITRNEAGDWIVPEKGGYPADFERVKRTILGLANMKTAEPKTADPKLFAELGLADVETEGSTAVQVTLKSGGKELATALVGERKYGAGPGGARSYVRIPGGERAWLADGAPEIAKTVKDWLKPEIVAVDRDRVREAQISGRGRETLTVVRASPADENFSVVNLPAGAKLDYETAPNAIGGALTSLEFEDVRPAGEIDMSGASNAIFRTFHGLELRVKIAEIENAAWATFEASAMPRAAKRVDPEAGDAADPHTEAETINKRLKGWAYKLPEYKARDLTKRLSDLLAGKS